MLLSEHIYCVTVTCKITERAEQQICIKFSVKLEHSSAHTIQMIQKAFGDDAMTAVQIKVWHKHFKDGWKCVESEPRSGRPATSRTPENVECVWAAISSDQWLIVWELEADLRITKTAVSEISMQEFGMKCVMSYLIYSFCYGSRRNIVLHLLMTSFKLLLMNQIWHLETFGLSKNWN